MPKSFAQQGPPLGDLFRRTSVAGEVTHILGASSLFNWIIYRVFPCQPGVITNGMPRGQPLERFANRMDDSEPTHGESALTYRGGQAEYARELSFRCQNYAK